MSSNESTSSDSAQVKVLFPFDSGFEGMWADRLGGSRYRLDNVPLFAYDISYGDEFLAEHEDGAIRFHRVTKRGGNWTYRATINEGAERGPRLDSLICMAKERAKLVSTYGLDYYAFSVGDDERHALEDVLQDGSTDGYWDWEMSSGGMEDEPK